MKLDDVTQFKSNVISHLQQYNWDDVRNGLKLFADNATAMDLDEQIKDSGNYSVIVETDEEEECSVQIHVSGYVISDECNCSVYKKEWHCKHIPAAIMEVMYYETDLKEDDIIRMVQKKVIKVVTEEEPRVVPATSGRVISLFGEKDNEIGWSSFESDPVRVFSTVYYMFGYVHNGIQNANKIALIAENNEVASWDFEFKAGSKIYYPQIIFDRNITFKYRCTCKDLSSMCIHVKASFDVLQRNGNLFFANLKDWSSEKARMLDEYGLKLEDEEAKQFEFIMDYYGGLQMKPPVWLWAKNAETKIANFKKQLASANDALLFSERPKLAKESIIDFQVGLLFNFLSQHFKIGFELETVKVFDKPAGKHFKKLSIHNDANLALLKELPDEVYHLLLNLTNNGVKEYLSKNGHGYVGNYSNPWLNMSESTPPIISKYYLQQLKKLWPYVSESLPVYQLREGTFSKKDIKPAKLSAEPLHVTFFVEEDERFITIRMQFLKNEEIIDGKNVEIHAVGIFIIDDLLFLPANIDDLDVIRQFQHGFIKIPINNRLAVITNVIPALQKKYIVHLPQSLQLKTVEALPKPQILLKEYNTQYLMLQPQFVYDDIIVDYESNPQNILQTLPDGSWQVMQRNAAKEKAFFENLRLLHYQFDRQKQNDFFYLPFDDVMKKNWFINTVHQLQDNDIPVLGMQELKKFRYNTNKPNWDMKAGSGTDWFDLTIKVSFGEQHVALKDVRKAIINKQNIVLLGDGTIGVLPEEWLQQFGLILKIGNELKDGTIRLSKLHYTLIDELHDQIDDDQVLLEINNKKQRLQNIENVKTVGVSDKINASLRPYQLSGFQWMQTLDELGWGGCLADDMGLGKTLQAITFLQFLKEKYAGCTNLVICPTSLIYNWESELKKFASSLTYHIYYGSAREFSNEHFEDYDIIITSYGIVRNDLEQLLKFDWHYVILDESQTIKNPDTQTNKAVQLLKSKNRFILSGTPVQNNTYDLYAQFNFINPGLLGNREFYKEFANGIDKHNDPEKATQLRKLVYPFMLRRTKEQVATDLPDKTEMVLWCEMSKEQRAVYDDYKNYYRTTLLKKIEEVGMAKAGMYILEGLLRLRQICDSPQLVKNEEVTTNKSVKIDELVREVQENTGQHKLLVFSQFTGMLELIKERMEQAGILYSYLDGSTTADNRKKAVDNFQTDPSIKVFLISLKAGGLGLNLTAADYVYLVDPWWNPAVEQQAIDRTHRIGQKNKIFAYKMICKNTIEEKIMELQQRKKQIANELVTEDAGFIKKLGKEDIEFLFN